MRIRSHATATVALLTSTIVGIAHAGETPIDLVLVPASAQQPGGPAYDFRIGRHETTNAQFVAFLNDAIAHFGDERGQHVFVHAPTGDVYINTSSVGTVGSVPPSPAIPLFVAGVAGAIEYVNAEYRVRTQPTDFANHPVAGVSWYGAVKYCNWLTIRAGLGAGERCYSEGSAAELGAWRPVTVSDAVWSDRELNESEREALLMYAGFRLPMDDGGAAGPFNEWYKAAAWDGLAGLNRAYGFGRDLLTSADANFGCAADPCAEPVECLLNGLTPVGFFDGSDHGGTSPTNAETNGFGLFDLSGNVWEWMQDRTDSAADRRNRGGSFRSCGPSLLAAFAAERSAAATVDSTGFRVVQSALDRFFVTSTTDFVTTGPWGGPLDSGAQASFCLLNLTDAPTNYFVSTDSAWMTIDGPGSGAIAPGQTAVVVVTIDPDCDGSLAPGAQVSTVLFEDLSNGIIISRRFRANLSEPLDVAPLEPLMVEMAFGGAPDPPSGGLSLENVSQRDLSWSASWRETSVPFSGIEWAGVDLVDGVLAAGASVNLVIQVHPGRLAAGVHESVVEVVDECTGTRFVRSVVLAIDPPLALEVDGPTAASGVCGGPFAPDVFSVTLVNQLSANLDWTAAVVSPESAFIELVPAGGTIPPLGETNVELHVMAAADALSVGSYTAVTRFTIPSTGFTTDATIELEVEPVRVQPVEPLRLAGPLGGPFQPPDATYTIHNTGVTEMNWTATFVDTSRPPATLPWVVLEPSQGTILNADGTAEVLVRLADSARLLPSGTYSGRVEFASTAAPGCPAARMVTLNVGGERFALDMAVVLALPQQPNGPDFTYRIAKTEVTNSQFVRFLNDALANPNTPRGAYLAFDMETGAVRLSGDGTLLFDPQVSGRISWEDSRYAVPADYENRPISGVTWFGALKFCNWLTLVQGMTDPDQRAYHEGPQRTDWYPVVTTAAAYAFSDLAAAQRQQLAEQIRGFRLPMDDGAGAVSLFNEWFKAAAWRPSTLTTVQYGFGRNTISNRDANFLDSCDPFEADGTTPVAYYDGSALLAGNCGVTRANANAYGAFDLTGNIAEWVQDFGGTAAERATRGGHYANSIDSTNLLNHARMNRTADAALPFVGFRIAQALEPGLIQLDRAPVRLTGYAGGPYDGSHYVLSLTNPSDHTADNLSLASGAAWLSLPEAPLQLVPPGATVDTQLSASTDPAIAVLSPSPGPSFVLVPGADAAPDGPGYDFWMSRTEVTNREFSDFLNGALANAQSLTPDSRSAHMYFDQDSGSVYINNQAAPTIGHAAPSDMVFAPLYDASLGRIRLAGGTYAPDSGYDAHPAVGVTWYGAVKYCNWRTTAEGIPSALRAYHEGASPALASWRPVSVDDLTWDTNGLSPDARHTLVQETLGYRLPMDGTFNAIAGFNEWRKAAAWDAINTNYRVYGFGRDQLFPEDANYLASGDGSIDNTTPVGFFDGTHTLFHAISPCDESPFVPTPTRATSNSYGIVDASGNVSEWTQEKGTSPDTRIARGGSWRSPMDSQLLTTSGAASLPAVTAYDDVGFRVVRGTGQFATVSVTDSIANVNYATAVVLDTREPLGLSPNTDASFAGLYGHSLVGLTVDYHLHNHSMSAMNWTVQSDAEWLSVIETSAGGTSGTLDSGAEVVLRAMTNASTEHLGPGEFEAVLTVQNNTTGSVLTRRVHLAIQHPAALVSADGTEQYFNGYWGGPFVTPQASRTITLTSHISFPLSFAVSANAEWVDISPGGGLVGQLQAGTTRSFEISVGDSADGLSPGRYAAAVQVTMTDPSAGGASWQLSQMVALAIKDPLSILPETPIWSVGPEIDPNSLPTQTYTLTNNASSPSDVTVSVDQPWLVVNTTFLELAPAQTAEVQVALSPPALQLPHGQHVGRVTIGNNLTGEVRCREVQLQIDQPLAVTPYSGFVSAGVAGGLVTPIGMIYHLDHLGNDAGGLQWTATIAPREASWLMVNGAATAGGTIPLGGEAELLVSIDLVHLLELDEGSYAATVTIRDETNNQTSLRSVALTLVVPAFAVASTTVAASAVQPNGPAYGFRIARFPTTNAEYAAFLNDALANPDNERGQFMYFDTTTGDVYVNTATQGESGAGVQGRTTAMFRQAAAGQIHYADGVYSVVQEPRDYTDHPVSGVSWYGAIKYANWLTIDQGMPPMHRPCLEDTQANLAGWRPATIGQSDWLQRDLNDAERLALVTDYRGFRLPMDDGANNGDPALDSADGFNEWYKAAAWNPVSGMNRLYGFGRNTLLGTDANFRDSGDPYDNGSTPVGYYGGPNEEPVFPTGDNDNGFGVFDLTGNVYHWVLGRFNANPNSISFRVIRGGSWNDAVNATTLRNTSRTFTTPVLTDPLVGFRVVRTLPPPTGDLDGDGGTDGADFAIGISCFSGPLGTAHGSCAALDLDTDDDVDLRDFAGFTNLFDGP